MNLEIAERLTKYRKEFGLSQEELAIKLYISRQSISKWERSESSPDTDNLINLSKIYGVSLDELLNTKVSEINIKHTVSTGVESKEMVKPLCFTKRIKPNLNVYLLNIISFVIFLIISFVPFISSFGSYVMGDTFYTVTQLFNYYQCLAHSYGNLAICIYLIFITILLTHFSVFFFLNSKLSKKSVRKINIIRKIGFGLLLVLFIVMFFFTNGIFDAGFFLMFILMTITFILSFFIKPQAIELQD